MKHNATTNAGPRDGFQDKLLQLIYNHALGRALILPFTHPVISKIGGYCMDSSLSRILIPSFIRTAHIDLSQCELPAGGRYRSFNDLFTRRLLPQARPFDPDPLTLASPCDARLTAYSISPRRVFHIKQTAYRLEDLDVYKRQSTPFSRNVAMASGSHPLSVMIRSILSREEDT